MTDVFSKEKRSEIMSKIRSKNTKLERDFQQEHSNAVPHPDWLPYHPDFLLNGEVVFLDSTFWHGKISQEKYEKMNRYWRGKLLRNIIRDIIASSFYETIGVLKRIAINGS